MKKLNTLGTPLRIVLRAVSIFSVILLLATSCKKDPKTVPSAPTIGVATALDASVSVTFTAPASDGNSPITSYSVTQVTV